MVIKYTDGNGALWRQAFGPFDLLVSRTDAQGRSWRYDYDKESQQLIAVTDPDGNQWQWWLDAEGQVVRERDMAGTETRYQFDEDGLCIAVINGEGESRHFLYDGRGLLLRETSGSERTDYQYDAAGRLTAVTSGDSESRFEYDDRDRVVAEWSDGQHIRRVFDDTARTVSRTLQWSEDDAELTSLWRYSRTGELQEVVLPDGATLTLTHDAAGREAMRSAGAFARSREYNLMGWLSRESSGQQQDGRLQPDQTREYRYDGAGNLKAVRHNRQAKGFELDATGRVLSVFTAGPDRNTTVEERYGYTRSGQPQDAGRLADWQAGRLVQQDDTHYRYDRAGRLVSRQRVQPGFRGQAWHYRWDSRNQLRQLETPDGKRWEYRYDSFGRRISKRHGDEEVRFLWDGDQPAEVRHYRNGECISRRHWVHNGWELLVQQRQITPEQWETDFVTSDQNGAPQALYGDDGRLRWQPPKATLWGRRTVNDDSPDPGLAFAGQYRDSESGLCYNRFRYYDPDGGCYISPDPIGIAGGESNYGYVHNPVGWVDPLGLSSFDPFLHGEITEFPKDLHFGQNRIAPNFSNIGSQAADSIAGRPILDVAMDIKAGRISPDTFVISYTIDPVTGKPVTLNNRGLAALVESGKFPQNAIHVPYEHVPKHLVEDIRFRAPSQSINVTRNKDGSGLVKKIGKCG